MKSLGKHKDSLIGVNYELSIMDADQLAKELKATYKALKIKFDDFNTSNDGGDVAKNPPAEIYEYQNFFLLERKDGKKVLLDGFRRLLWYDAPKTPVFVRTYKQADLSDGLVLSLLINLNHFKFFSHSSYQERGFGLLLKTVFDIDITKFRDAFDAYLSSEETKNSYWTPSIDGSEKIDTIKERILNPFFIEDMFFMSKLNQNKCMVNEFFGALVYQKRQGKKEAFDAEAFLKLHKADKVLNELMSKFEKAGTNSSAKSQAAVNRIQETYNNFFTLMEGGAVEKTYAEKVQECKEIREAMNKDKAWTKLTGMSNYWLVERVMAGKVKDIKFKCLVMPKEDNQYRFGGIVPLHYGIHESVKFLRKETPSYMREEMVFGFTDPETGASWTVRHNYGGYNSYGKKYTKVRWEWNEKLEKKYKSAMSVEYDIELWVNIPKTEWQEKKK